KERERESERRTRRAREPERPEQDSGEPPGDTPGEPAAASRRQSNMSLQQRRPKGKIRPPRRTTTQDNFGESWERLSQAIREIHRMNAAQLSFEELYRTAYNMVLHKQGEKLHAGIRDVLTQYLDEVAEKTVVAAIAVSSAGTDASDAASPSGSTAVGPGGDAGSAARGTEFLKVLNQAWSQHTTCLFMIRDILMYMDLYYAKPCNVPQVYELGLDLFRDRIVRLPKLKRHLIYTLLKQIQLERDGEVIDRGVLKSVTHILLQLLDGAGKTVYRTDFEEEFLKVSEDFYRVEGQKLVDSCDAS
ncbi:MAG: Cullin repeat-like-containing domain protein, partial [Olpidium bornovanus]